MAKFVLEEYGQELQDIIDKVQELVAEGGDDATLLTAAERDKLSKLGIFCNTTAYWDAHPDYIPGNGMLVIYSDYSIEETPEGNIYHPAMKIGSGNAYLADLAFFGGDSGVREELQAHINNRLVHVSEADRAFWNRKLNVDDAHEVIDETLVFNRQ